MAVIGFRKMHKFSVAVSAFFFIAFSGVNQGAMSQHRASLVWQVKQIAVTLHALCVLDVSIGVLTIRFTIVFIKKNMCHDVLESVVGLGVEELESVMRCWKVTIHTVGNDPVFIESMTGCFPCSVSELDFMTHGTELRR
jgi:hypothetical protein